MTKYILFFVAAMVAFHASAQSIVTESKTDSTVKSTAESVTTMKSPPPSAISPSINSANSDLCTVGVAGAVQTQILGISAGSAFTDANCERLKLSKTLYDMGMKVAAVSTLCQDKRVFDAMMMAGTPCPYDGAIGSAAKEQWKANPSERPGAANKSRDMSNETKTLLGSGGIVILLLLLLL